MLLLSQYYDPRNERPPPPRNRRKQSTFSIALEALGGGLVIALFVLALTWLLGW